MNTPEILGGQAPSAGGLDIALEQASLVESVQVLTGTVTLAEPETFLRLVDMRVGDTFTAYAESTDGTLVPALVLEDFGGRHWRPTTRAASSRRPRSPLPSTKTPPTMGCASWRPPQAAT
ncbi:MAG: hypothetical protein R2851_11350 [Caldilineaceae bacterium]